VVDCRGVRIAIRDATEADAVQLAGLIGELGCPCSADEAAARMRELAESPASRLQVAERGGMVVGLVGTHIVPRLDRDRRSCRITDLVVAAPLRRSGIGSALLGAAEEEARRHAAPRIDLSSGDWRAESHSFYQRVGFESVSRTFTKRLG